jgi:hypothetical protein
MKANKIVAEVADLPFDCISQFGDSTPQFFRHGVCATLCSEIHEGVMTVSDISATINSWSASNIQFRAYVDVLGRLSGFVSYKMKTLSEAEIQLFRSSYGAASSFVMSLANTLDGSVETLSCNRRPRFHLNLKKYADSYHNKINTHLMFQQYWRQGEAIDVVSAARDLITQFSTLGFALQLCSNRQDFFLLPFPAFFQLIFHPAALQQISVLQDEFSKPIGLAAWAFVDEASANLKTLDLDKFLTLSEWRNGPLRRPVWQL